MRLLKYTSNSDQVYLKVYMSCLYLKELSTRNLNVKKQVPIPVLYKGEDLNAEFKVDILVENEIILELKSVEIILPVHKAQLLTYLRLSEKKLGYLINFNVPKLIDGFNRIVNNF